MSDISRVLNTSKEAILAHLSAMNITGSNIANVNTPGYSRLRPVFSSVGVSQGGASELQVGVKVTDAERVYDRYLESQLVQRQQDVAYDEARKSALERVEGIFNESGGSGINEVMSKFWNAWQDLAANPAGTVERDVLVSVSQSLADVFSQKAEDLVAVQQDMNAAISDDVTLLNSYVAEIAQLNEKIVQTVSGGGNASDLIDKRMETMRKLGGLIDYDYIEDAAGAVSIFLSNGKPLVEGSITWEMEVVADPGNSNYYDIVFSDNAGEAVNGSITKGRLAGCLEIRDTSIAGYLTKLNSLAENLVNAVNSQHQLGYDQYGNLGGNFFNPVTEAADMQVSAAIAADVGKIACSGSVNNDGDNAVEIADIKSSLLMESGTATLSNYYSSLMAEVGQDVVDAGWSADRNTVIMSQLENQRETVSGVSLDEEMMNLIKFQLGYNAAGKLAGVVGEMMDTLLGLVAD